MATMNPLGGPQYNRVDIYSISYQLDQTDFAACAAGTTTQDWLLDTIPAGATILDIRVKPSTALAGTSLSSAKIRLGDGTTTDKYMSDYEMYGVTPAVGSFGYQPGPLSLGKIDSVTLKATLTTVGCHIEDLTAGHVWITVLLARPLYGAGAV